MKNAELAYKILDHIRENPKEWDQSTWHCGTTHCFAGFAELFTTGEIDDETDGARTWNIATEALGITDEDAYTLFNPTNTLSYLEYHTRVIFGYRQDALVKTGFCHANEYPIT